VGTLLKASAVVRSSSSSATVAFSGSSMVARSVGLDSGGRLRAGAKPTRRLIQREGTAWDTSQSYTPGALEAKRMVRA